MQQSVNQTHSHSDDPETTEVKGVTRREVLLGIMASVGVVTTAGCVDNVEKSLSSPAPAGNLASGMSFYNQDEFKLVSILANLIIPDTDTIGALAVGVPSFMDRLFNEWASTESKQKHRKATVAVTNALNDIANEDFLTASADKQLSALTTLDNQAFSNQNKAAWDYRSIKTLIARFYYFSEVGATKELRYELVPGRWEACVPVEKIGRTWAA